MRQRITPHEVMELNNRQVAFLQHWWMPQIGDLFIGPQNSDHEFYVVADKTSNVAWIDQYGNEWSREESVVPLLTLGQMIEILRKKRKYPNIVSEYNFWNVYHKSPSKFLINESGQELCEVLWEAVKAVL